MTDNTKIEKALRVWSAARAASNVISSLSDNYPIGVNHTAAARVIMEAYPEPEKPSADMIARATMRLQAEQLNDATDNAIYRRILRQTEEVT